MGTSLSEFALGIVLDLVKNAITKVVDASTLEYFERRKVTRRVEDAVANIVEPLLPFLANEKIDDDKQRRLLETCVSELRPLSLEPEKLFQGSLNGQKIFENLYTGHALPQVVFDDGVKDVYVLLFPRIAEVLCKVPAAVKEWETLAWAENYRRLDDLVREMRGVYNKVDDLQRQPEHQADEILGKVRRALLQKVGLEMDITGLRGDQPLSGKLSEFFVHPIIRKMPDDKTIERIVLEKPEEALAQFTRPNQKAIIFGAPGAGKSTWTRWLQREILGQSGKGFCVRTELRSYAGQKLTSMYDLVRQAVGINYAEELTPAVIGRWLEQGLLVFIFDGFDEIRPEERDQIYAWIVEFVQAAHGCPVVITSRPLTTDHLERRDVFDAHWIILSFDLERIIEYIQHWYQHVPLLAETGREVDASALADEWQRDPTLQPLTGNPLLLSTLLMVHHLDGKLPTGRSQLYKRYIDGMLGLWDDRRKLVTSAESLNPVQKKQILRGLALHMFLQELDQLDEAALLDWLQGFLKKAGIQQDAAAVLNVLRERSGLIIGPGVYTFAHKSIAEYLVAEVVWEGDQTDLSGQRIDRMYLLTLGDNDRWNSVIFLWAGLASAADLVAFIEACQAVDNWKLAYGILDDQFERIRDRETRRRLLLSDKREENQIFGPTSDPLGQAFYVIGFPASMSLSFFIPLENIRSMTTNRRYDFLINKAIRDKTLTFDDRLSIPSDYQKQLFWFNFLPTTGDIDGLKVYIKARSPLFSTDEDWSIYIISRLLQRAIDQREDINLIINLCHILLAEYSWVIPLILLSLFCSNTILTHADSADDPITYLRNIFSAIPDSGMERIHSNWLLGTNDWELPGNETMEPDLFLQFARMMEQLDKVEISVHDEAFERSLLYVGILHAQRRILAEQRGIDLDAERQKAKTERQKVGENLDNGEEIFFEYYPPNANKSKRNKTKN